MLKNMVSDLPGDLPAPVFVVMHVSATHPSILPEILSNVGPLRAIHPEDGRKIEQGFIYVAPPDQHLLIDDGHVAVKKGPKENGFRPSIDALFRSAAYSFGPAAIGVVLSGALHDGTSGLWTIKRLGGTAIVQDPNEAEYSSMPRSALEYVDADYTALSSEIAPLLVHLAHEQPEIKMMPGNPAGSDLEERIATEVNIAAGVSVPQEVVLDLGELTPFTCPACQGVLTRIKEGNRFRFRCHTGHAFSEDSLLTEITHVAEDKIWQVVRSLQETEMLLAHIGKHIQDAGEPARAEKFFSKAREIGKRAARFHDLVLEHENLSKDNLSE